MLLFYVGMAAWIAEVAPHPMNVFTPIGRRKGIDINISFVIGSACYAELSPVVDLALRSVFADDPKWRSVPPVMVFAARSALAGDLDRALTHFSPFEFSTHLRLCKHKVVN